MDSNTLTLVNIVIDRGRDVLTAAVPEHEIRVLKFVHGGDKVRSRDVEQEGDEQDFDISADAEYDRLTRKYHRVNSTNPVRLAYPNGAMQLVDFGFQMGREGASDPPAAMVVKHPKPAKVAPPDDSQNPPDIKAAKAGK